MNHPRVILLVAVGALSVSHGRQLAGQEVVPPPPADADSSATPVAMQLSRQRPVSPMGALWRSFLIPGWGQAKLNRKVTGGLFMAVEGVTLGMVIKSSHQLGYLRRTGSPSADAKRQEREDWITLLVFNHLMSGLEAFVAAHLWDFPDDLELLPAPAGYGARVSIPF